MRHSTPRNGDLSFFDLKFNFGRSITHARNKMHSDHITGFPRDMVCHLFTVHDLLAPEVTKMAGATEIPLLDTRKHEEHPKGQKEHPEGNHKNSGGSDTRKHEEHPKGQKEHPEGNHKNFGGSDTSKWYNPEEEQHLQIKVSRPTISSATH
jgi:hypothetical protein